MLQLNQASRCIQCISVLLDNVCQLVRQQPPTSIRIWRILTNSKHYVLSQCEGTSVEIMGKLCSLYISMYTHIAKVMSKSRLKKAATVRWQRLSSFPQLVDLSCQVWSCVRRLAWHFLGLQDLVFLFLLQRLPAQFVVALRARTLNVDVRVQSGACPILPRLWLGHAHDLVCHPVRFLFVFVVWLADFQLGLHAHRAAMANAAKGTGRGARPGQGTGLGKVLAGLVACQAVPGGLLVSYPRRAER